MQGLPGLRTDSRATGLALYNNASLPAWRLTHKDLAPPAGYDPARTHLHLLRNCNTANRLPIPGYYRYYRTVTIYEVIALSLDSTGYLVPCCSIGPSALHDTYPAV